VDELRNRYPWPSEMPNVPVDPHGWFGWCHEEVLGHMCGPETKLILELGSWLGKSTRWILGRCPNATVIAVDHWKGSPEIEADDKEAGSKEPTLYETFLANCWEYRDRLIPMRTETTRAMPELVALGIKPELVFIDASHTYEDVKADLTLSSTSFPGARLCGDDYGGKWTGVKKAVDELCANIGMRVYHVEQAWSIVPTDSVDPELSQAPPNYLTIEDYLNRNKGPENEA
jgi:hypothetical protein